MTGTFSAREWRRDRHASAAGFRMFLATVLTAILCACGTVADAHVDEDPFQMVAEEQIVTGASKRPQRISETPSLVSVITAAEIRDMGYRTLGEALQWARGFYVSYDRNYTYLGEGGLLRPGDYNNKILLTIDGHTMNGAVYGDATFGPELGLDMETVERIEIVRGPGSTLYGSYAVLAMVNVVTRRPQNEDAAELGGRVGGQGDVRGFGGVATAKPGKVAAQVHGSWTRTSGNDLYFPAFDSPSTNFGRALGADGERATNLSGAVEWSGFRLAARWNDRMKRIPTAAFGTRFDDRDNRTFDGHNMVELSTSRMFRSGAGLDARLYWDAVRYKGDYLYGPDSARVLNFDRGDADQIGVENRVHWSLYPRHLLTLGVEGAISVLSALQNYDVNPSYVYVDKVDRGKDRRIGLYAQTESRFGTAVRVTAGARWDDHGGGVSAVSPRADVVWQAGRATTVKLLFGTAFRVPSKFELDYTTGTYLINPDLRPERVVTTEAGIEHRFGTVRAQAVVFHSRVRDLIDLVQLDSVQLQYQNASSARLFGGGLEFEVANAAGRRGRLSLSLQRGERINPEAELTNSPRLIAQCLVIEPAFANRATFGIGMRYRSPVWTLAGERTTSAVVADGRIGWRPRHGIELGLEGRNLFDVRWTVPASSEHVMDQIQQDGRQATLTLTLTPAH